MAITVEVKKRTFKLEIVLGGEIDQNEADVVKDVALSFMESRACQEDDVPDGVDVADKLHTAALAGHEHTGNGVGWRIGKMYALWGDNLFKDPQSKDQLKRLLKGCMTGAVEGGGSLLFQALKAILCDKYGIVTEIRIERLASVLKLCWDLFKLALLEYTVEKAFQVLGYILTYLIKFLQESRFFAALRQLGGWEDMQRMITSYYKPEMAQAMKYFMVASVSVVVGGVIVYLYLNKKN